MHGADTGLPLNKYMQRHMHKHSTIISPRLRLTELRLEAQAIHILQNERFQLESFPFYCSMCLV